MAIYQGKPTRPVPEEVVVDIEEHLLDTARHLIDLTVPEADRIRRFARVTRVHILSLLRTTGNGKYSRWYRESHYIHRPVCHSFTHYG
jgi:hypothetical protein